MFGRFAMLALLPVFLIVSAALVAKIIAWAVVERPSLEIKNAGIFGIAGVIVVAVVGLLTGATGNFWIFISAMFVACLICFGVGENSKKAQAVRTKLSAEFPCPNTGR